MPQAGEYYRQYDDRYRSVYAQGGEYWTSDPREISDTIGLVREFLDRWRIPPAGRIVEPGCGEGHIARFLLASGYQYCGIDLSPEGLTGARRRIAELQPARDPFILADVTRLDDVPGAPFDAAVDNFCLHMLVVDGDRRRYLEGLRRILAPGAMAFFHENYTDRPIDGKIDTFENFVALTGFDLNVVDDRTAFGRDGQIKISLPRVPFRAQDEAGHRRELKSAGFDVLHFAFQERQCVIHAKAQ